MGFLTLKIVIINNLYFVSEEHGDVVWTVKMMKEVNTEERIISANIVVFYVNCVFLLGNAWNLKNNTYLCT